MNHNTVQQAHRCCGNGPRPCFDLKLQHDKKAQSWTKETGDTELKFTKQQLNLEHGLLVFISNVCWSELLNFLTLAQSGPGALVSDEWNCVNCARKQSHSEGLFDTELFLFSNHPS